MSCCLPTDSTCSKNNHFPFTGTRESPPPITTMAPAPITTNRLTISPATTTSRTTQEYTQSELTNPNQTAIHKVRNESNSTLSTTLQQTESFPSSAFSQRDRVTLVMGVVGGVVGLLLLIVIIVCSILLCIAASSYHKIKTASGQNKYVTATPPKTNAFTPTSFVCTTCL